MEVILLERVENLGSIGDVVTVKNGYARNYLLPNKKALRANDANKAVFIDQVKHRMQDRIAESGHTKISPVAHQPAFLARLHLSGRHAQR